MSVNEDNFQRELRLRKEGGQTTEKPPKAKEEPLIPVITGMEKTKEQTFEEAIIEGDKIIEEDFDIDA